MDDGPIMENNKKASFSHFFPGFERVLEASTPPLRQSILSDAQSQAATIGPNGPGEGNTASMTSRTHLKTRSLNGLLITTITDTKVECVSVQSAIDDTAEVDARYIDGGVSNENRIDLVAPDGIIVNNPQTDIEADNRLPANNLHNDHGIGQPKDMIVEDERDHIAIFNDQGVDVTKIPRPIYHSKSHPKVRQWITPARSENRVKNKISVSSTPATKCAAGESEGALIDRSKDSEAGRRLGSGTPIMASEVADRSTSVQCGSPSNQHKPGVREEPEQNEVYGPQEKMETYFNHRSGPDMSNVGKDGDVYTNLWHKTDEGGRILHTFVNDEDVSFRFTTQDLFSDNTQKKTPPTNLEKFQSALWKAGGAVDRRINELERGCKVLASHELFKAKIPPPIETQFEIDMFYYLNPPEKTRQYDNSPPGMLSSITEAFYRAFARRPARRPRRNTWQQGIASPDLAGHLDECKKKQIGKWINRDASIEWEEADYFVACTTAQLKKLNGDTLDRMRVIKMYIGPPTTPVHGPVCTADMAANEQSIQLEPYESDPMSFPSFVSSKKFNPHAVHKDLARLLGTRKSAPHVFGSHLPQYPEQAHNISEYYGMPILESCERLQYNQINTPDGQDSDDHEINISSEYDRRYNFSYPMHTLPPAQSLILFLSGKGMDCNTIGTVLATLDEKFVYQWPSRWWNGFRIPDHWQFTEDMVEEIKSRCCAGKHWWVEEFNCHGSFVSAALENLTSGKNVRAAALFARKVLENYYWWRCRNGEKYHKEVLSI